jgi:hypothetical protein
MRSNRGKDLSRVMGVQNGRRPPAEKDRGDRCAFIEAHFQAEIDNILINFAFLARERDEIAVPAPGMTEGNVEVKA